MLSEEILYKFGFLMEFSKAAGEVFNCATSSQITYDDLATMCGKAAGNEATKIVHYDPKKFDIPKGFSAIFISRASGQRQNIFNNVTPSAYN